MMPEGKLRKIITDFFEELSLSLVEERVINYIIRELHSGRRLSSILKDPYIKNRISEERISHILENKKLIEAVEEEISRAFIKDFKIFEST